MHSTRTQRCTEHGHPEFLLRYEKLGVSANDIDWLKSYLERRIAMGLEVDAGDLLTIGWLGLRVIAVGEGLLGLEEPDMTTYPVTWQESVTFSLQHLRLQ
ncbi:MAG: hypothetical protein RBU37_28240, partial [Myxococcota bacterium]|nr:hypothetical protein [Myxococcota bacterium]